MQSGVRKSKPWIEGVDEHEYEKCPDNIGINNLYAVRMRSDRIASYTGKTKRTGPDRILTLSNNSTGQPEAPFRRHKKGLWILCPTVSVPE